MERVEVTRSFHTIFSMQVCAVADATNEEILEVCNSQNPAGTTNGWVGVIMTKEDIGPLMSEKWLPVPCEENEGRMHYLVTC